MNEQLTTLVRLSWQFAKLGNRSLLPTRLEVLRADLVKDKFCLNKMEQLYK